MDLNTPHHLAAHAASLRPAGFDPGLIVVFDRVERENGLPHGLEPWRTRFATEARQMTPAERQLALYAIATFINGGSAFSGSAPAEVLPLPDTDPRHRAMAALGAAAALIHRAQAAAAGEAHGFPHADCYRRENRPGTLARLGWQPPPGLAVTALKRTPRGTPAAVLVEAEGERDAEAADRLAATLNASLAAGGADRIFRAIALPSDPHVPRARCIVMPTQPAA